MPPFKKNCEVDPLFNGDTLAALRDSGDGKPIFVIGQGYEDAADVTTLEYPGTTFMALNGIAKLISLQASTGVEHIVPEKVSDLFNHLRSELEDFETVYGLKPEQVSEQSFSSQLRIDRSDGILPIVIRSTSQSSLASAKVVVGQSQEHFDVPGLIRTASKASRERVKDVIIDKSEFRKFGVQNKAFGTLVADRTWGILVDLYIYRHYPEEFIGNAWFKPESYLHVNLDFDEAPEHYSSHMRNSFNGLRLSTLKELVDQVDSAVEKHGEYGLRMVLGQSPSVNQKSFKFMQAFLESKNPNQ